jgi:hypothetical protein
MEKLWWNHGREGCQSNPFWHFLPFQIWRSSTTAAFTGSQPSGSSQPPRQMPFKCQIDGVQYEADPERGKASVGRNLAGSSRRCWKAVTNGRRGESNRARHGARDLLGWPITILSTAAYKWNHGGLERTWSRFNFPVLNMSGSPDGGFLFATWGFMMDDYWNGCWEQGALLEPKDVLHRTLKKKKDDRKEGLGSRDIQSGQDALSVSGGLPGRDIWFQKWIVTVRSQMSAHNTEVVCLQSQGKWRRKEQSLWLWLPARQKNRRRNQHSRFWWVMAVYNSYPSIHKT